MHLLIVEDNVDLAESVADFFESKGDTTVVAHTARDAERILAEHAQEPGAASFDAAVVDVMLPGGRSGVQLCRRLRGVAASGATYGEMPILLLTALDSLDDKLTGFEAGADDYLTKPFSLHELYARLGALTRRAQRQARRGAAAATPREGSHVVVVGDLRIDVGQQLVLFGAHEVQVSESGLKILTLLAQHAPNVVERRSLERALWPSRSPDSDALKTHIYNVRRALQDARADVVLKTVRGRGYRLVAAPGAGPGASS